MRHFPVLLPGKYATLFLRIALPLILLSTVTLLLSYLGERDLHPLLARQSYAAYFEYTVASCVKSAVGALLISYIEQTQKN